MSDGQEPGSTPEPPNSDSPEPSVSRAEVQAQRATGPRRVPLKAFFGRLAIALVVTTVLMAGGVSAVNREIDSRVARIKRVDVTVAAAPPEGANYLIIGSDTREIVDPNDPSQVEAYGEEESGRRSDTMMVAHVEPGSKRTLVVSFPRDLMVNVPGLSGKNMLNSAYATGGPDAVIQMLDLNWGVPIQHYVEVNFNTFQNITNAIGSVPVFFEFPARDGYTNLSVPTAGCVNLDGVQALAYVRSRYLEVEIDGEWVPASPRADLDRIVRQQDFVRRLAGLAIQQSLGDPFLALDLSERVLEDITADASLTSDNVKALINAFKTVDVNDTSTIQFETVPVIPYPPNPNARLAEMQPDFDDLMTRLRTFGNDPAPAQTVQPNQVQLRVLDGNGRNEAIDATTQLTNQGFRTSPPGTAKKTVDVTEIRYPAALAAYAKFMLSYFPEAKLVPDDKLTDTLSVVLGANFTTITVPTTPVTTLAPVAGEPTTTTAPLVPPVPEAPKPECT